MIALYAFPDQTTWEEQAQAYGLIVPPEDREEPVMELVELDAYHIVYEVYEEGAPGTVVAGWAPGSVNPDYVYERTGTETIVTPAHYRAGIKVHGTVPGRTGWLVVLNLRELDQQGFEPPESWDQYLSYEVIPPATYAGFEGPQPPVN